MSESLFLTGLQSILVANPHSALSDEWAGDDPERFSRAKLGENNQLIEL